MKKNIINKIVPILLIINTSLFIISFSISFTLLFKPFYYIHINTLDLVKKTDYSYNEIRESYDDVIDYIVLNKPFKTGKLKYSSNGKNHFKDCKVLFTINFIILGLSSLIIILKKKYLSNIKFLNHNIGYWSGYLILISFLILLIISLVVGFNDIFIVFHHIFFFGKTNWLLSPMKDEIINILPQQYFMDCAILILVIITTISLVLIIKEKIKK